MRMPPILANATLLALWLWLFRPVYPYLAVIFTRQEFRTNQIVLAGVVLLIILQMHRRPIHLKAIKPPHLYSTALLFALGGAALFILVERFLDINTLSATIFGLASYGMLGLWMSPAAWRQGLPAALLLIGALPFGEHMQTFIGYPVRIATASIVRDGLAVLGVHSVGIDTILVFENGISQVDLPCSGVQSLWTGGLFLLAATWVERNRINVRWLVVLLVFSIALLAANLARVGVLVAVGEVAGLRFLAEMLHVPLGVLGFVAACALAVSLLHWSQHNGRQDSTTAGQSLSAIHLPQPAWLAPALGGIFLVLTLLYSPRPQVVAAQESKSWIFPPEMQVDAWPLSQGEVKYLNSDTTAIGDRWHFTWGELSGSLLTVTSDSWRGQHRPERCFEVYGLTVEDAGTYLVSPDFPLRLLSLKDGKQQALFSAAYWFQTANQVTDDYGTRIWADLSPGSKPWVLVTVLFDDPDDYLDLDALAFYSAIRQAVANRLVGGGTP
jgi:exosortase O